MWAQSCPIWPSLTLVWLGQIQSSMIWSGLAAIQARVLEECFRSLVLKLRPGVIQFHEDHLSVLFVRLACGLQRETEKNIRMFVSAAVMLKSKGTK